MSFPGTPSSSFVWLGQQSPKPWRHSTTPYLIAWPPCTPFHKRLEWLDPLGNASDLPILLSSGPRPRLVDGGTSSHCPQRGAVVWHESQPRSQNDRQDAAEVLLRGTVYLGQGRSNNTASFTSKLQAHGRRLTPHKGSLLEPVLTTAINRSMCVASSCQTTCCRTQYLEGTDRHRKLPER